MYFRYKVIYGDNILFMTSPASNPRKNCHQSTYLFRAVTCVSILMSDMKCLLTKARKDFQHLDLFAQSVLRSSSVSNVLFHDLLFIQE